MTRTYEDAVEIGTDQAHWDEQFDAAVKTEMAKSDEDEWEEIRELTGE